MVQQRVADLVRECHGRLLALLAAPTRDIAAAEDALSPTRWRARNRMRDMWKSHAYRMTRPIAEPAYRVAIDLTGDAGVQEYLREQLRLLERH